MKKIAVLILMLLSILEVNAQAYKFEIISKGKSVGTVECRIDTVKDIVNVNVLALAEIHFLIGERVKYKLTSNYKDGQLYFSSATFYLNDKAIYKSTVRKENNYYTITEDDHQTMFNNLIDYTGSILYLIEPKDKKEIFSEIDNVLKPITKIGDSKYKIVNPETGKISYFTYKDGILSDAQISHTYVKMEIKRLN